MQNEAKISCYQELYSKLKEEDALSDFGWPSEKEHLDFYFKAGSTDITFRIYSNKDLMQLRSETPRLEYTDEENIQLAREISKNYYGIFGTAYDGKIIFNLSVPFPSIADEAGKQLIYEKTNYFINMILSQLEVEYVKELEEDKRRREAEMEDDKGKKRKLSLFPKRKQNSSDFDTQEEIGEISEDEPVKEPSVKDDDLSDAFANTFASISEAEKTETVEIIDEEKQDASTSELINPETNTAETSEISVEQSEKVENAQDIQLETSTHSKEKWVDEEDKYEITPAVTEQKEINHENAEARSENSHETKEMTEIVEDTSECIDTELLEKDHQNSGEDISKKNESHKISPKEMQNVAELYESINRTFSMRKEQLDYREKMLSEQKHFLTCEQEQLQSQRSELEDKEKDLNRQEATLKQSWEQYHKTKKKQENKGSLLEEREKNIKHIEVAIQERENKVKQNIQKLEKREQLLSDKQEELDKNYAEYKEKVATLGNYEERLRITKQELADNELKASMQKQQMDMEKKAIEDKLNDLKDTEKMIEKLQKESKLFEVSTLQENLKKIREEKNALQKTNQKLDAENIELKQLQDSIQDALIDKTAMVNQMSQTIENMKEKLDLAERKPVNTEEVDTLKERVKEMQSEKQRDELRHQNEIEELRKTLNEVNQKYSSQQEEEKNTAPFNLIGALAEGGYIAGNTTRDGRSMLTFQVGGCDIFIDEEYGMVEIEKQTRRNYAKQMQDLNEANHSVAYCMGKGKAYCRFAYRDIAKEIRDNITIMIKFR